MMSLHEETGIGRGVTLKIIKTSQYRERPTSKAVCFKHFRVAITAACIQIKKINNEFQSPTEN